LLRLRRKLDLRGELERELRRALVDLPRLGIGERRERTERPGGARGCLLLDLPGVLVSATGATMAVINERPCVKRSTWKRSWPSTTMFSRPSSKRSSTSVTSARVPSSRTPSSSAKTSPNSVSSSMHSLMSSR